MVDKLKILVDAYLLRKFLLIGLGVFIVFSILLQQSSISVAGIMLLLFIFVAGILIVSELSIVSILLFNLIDYLVDRKEVYAKFSLKIYEKTKQTYYYYVKKLKLKVKTW